MIPNWNRQGRLSDKAEISNSSYCKISIQQSSKKTKFIWRICVSFLAFIFRSFPPLKKLDSPSNDRKDSRTIAHSGLKNPVPLPQIPPPLRPRVAVRKCRSGTCYPFFFREGKAFLILFISRSIWQSRGQIILVLKLWDFTHILLWASATPDFGENCWMESMGGEPRRVSTILQQDAIPQTPILFNLCLSLLVNETFDFSNVCHPRTSDSKEILFWWVSKLNVLFLYLDCTNLSLPHIETILAFMIK